MVPEAIGRGSGCGASEPPQPTIAGRKSMAAGQKNRLPMRITSESPNDKEKLPGLPATPSCRANQDGGPGQLDPVAMRRLIARDDQLQILRPGQIDKPDHPGDDLQKLRFLDDPPDFVLTGRFSIPSS